MGIFDYFRHGKRAKELGLTVSQYLEFVQYQESDKLTIEEYKSYLVQYSEDKSVRQYIDQMRTGVLGAQSKEAESGLISSTRPSAITSTGAISSFTIVFKLLSFITYHLKNLVFFIPESGGEWRIPRHFPLTFRISIITIP